MSKVVIIGGGASGLMAAYSASRNKNNTVILLERNGECGKKLNICGKGRGNITNIAPIKDFIEAFGQNGKFLYSVFSQFSNNELITLLNDNGLQTIVERGGRVFPKSEIARHIRDFFINQIKDCVNIKYGTKAEEIIAEDNRIIGVKIHDGIIKCDKVIIATGGKSYPKTGSTGDGYAFAKSVGHNITKLSPSICPILCNDEWIKEVAGLSLKNVELSFYYKDKLIKSEFGEMLFTHTGISGPIVLTVSKYISEIEDYKNINLSLDLKPALSRGDLYKKLTNEFKSNIIIKNYFNTILPKSLAKIFPQLCNLNPDKKVNIITKEEKYQIIDGIKKLSFSFKSLAPIEEAIVTKGGVDIKEINPKTMESKIVKGLYFCGEVIDIDAKTGGYNLQAAFSTGYVAGKLAE